MLGVVIEMLLRMPASHVKCALGSSTTSNPSFLLKHTQKQVMAEILKALLSAKETLSGTWAMV